LSQTYILYFEPSLAKHRFRAISGLRSRIITVAVKRNQNTKIRGASNRNLVKTYADF